MESASKPLIAIQKLNVTYFLGKSNEVRALQDINLVINPGEFVVFFGPSGCGKSTLLYSIAGLETHAQGSIFVADKQLTQMTRREIAHYRQKQIGMIFQAFYLIPTLNVLQNIVLPQMAIRAEPSARTKRAQELLLHFGVANQARKLPSELSGGQQQRVAICRALMNEPNILLADEPVGNLDSKSSNDVMRLLFELNQKQKKTIILVTHDPTHLHLANRVFYMRDGKIIDTKTNEHSDAGLTERARAVQPVSRDLELLLRTYTSIGPGQVGNLLIPFKAKEIVAEVLTGMTTDALGEIEKEVQHALMSHYSNPESLRDFLDRPIKAGGMELDRRTAGRLAARMQDIIGEIRMLQDQEAARAKGAPAKLETEVEQMRQYLMEVFKLTIFTHDALRNFDNAIKRRLTNALDRAQVFTVLDTSVLEGGVGLDRRTAQKVAKRIELLVLGKYNG